VEDVPVKNLRRVARGRVMEEPHSADELEELRLIKTALNSAAWA
jgi:hypothetical protein